jgi:hypothetical protein
MVSLDRRTGCTNCSNIGAPTPVHRKPPDGEEESNAVASRKVFYESLEQFQRNLDEYLAFGSRECAHHGCRAQGHASYKAFLGGDEQMCRQESKPRAALFTIRATGPPKYILLWRERFSQRDDKIGSQGPECSGE